MLHPYSIKRTFLEWAKLSFETEVSTNFKRAKTFDGPLSKVVLSALCGFSCEKLHLLARVLPTGVASTGSTGEDLRDRLLSEQKQVVEAFQQAVERVREAGRQEFSEYVARMRRKETLDEAKRVRKIAIERVKQLAAKWRYTIERIEPAVWSVSSSRSWGRLSVQFDFVSTMELHYAIFVYDCLGTPLRQHDHYLGVLGIGPSVWSTGTTDECGDKIFTAGEFIQWHLIDYDKIMAAL